ncbi:phosphoribosylamine--glycine ligase [Candidatus Peregrinibacteria bacterium]|nr:phosphoribosylamine--glycine ligase [Candidatus Peregrinibacteria bacterium]
MKILLVGNGAREHIMAEKIAQSPQCEELFVFASAVNPGIKALAAAYQVGDINCGGSIRSFAEVNKPDIAVIGPENPIAAGVVDELEAAGIPCASPTKKLGQLESSKAFTRALLEKYHIPGNPYFRTFESDEGMLEYAQSLGQFVVKADGLHGGKGVLVQGDHFETAEEGIEAAKKFIESDGYVVIEEKFIGQEFSLMSFVDGEHVIDMPPIQDHKRAFVGDTGPNTGGMGSYNFPGNLPFLTRQDLEDAHEITVRTAAALKQELEVPYKGIMYGGFIAVKNGVRLIEYNARLGDPEAMNALSLLETDYVDILKATIDGTLDQLKIKFSRKATVCKYVVPEGYPTNPKKNKKIEIGELPENIEYYLASVDQREDGMYMLGSRAVAFVGIADSTEEAEAIAQKGVEAVKGPVFFREDIGTKELIQKRIDMMDELRG